MSPDPKGGRHNDAKISINIQKSNNVLLLCLNINIPDQNIYSCCLDEIVVVDSSA